MYAICMDYLVYHISDGESYCHSLSVSKCLHHERVDQEDFKGHKTASKTKVYGRLYHQLPELSSFGVSNTGISIWIVWTLANEQTEGWMDRRTGKQTDMDVYLDYVDIG